LKTEKHGYKFTNKQNSRGGIFSIIIGILAFLLLIAGITIAYQAKGNAGAHVGLMGTGAFLISGLGLIKGLLSFKEKERFYAVSFAGCIINGVIWIAMVLIIAYGIVV
jgi:uncharacterized membrane protein